MTVTQCITQLDEKQKILNWLIQGQGKLGIPIKSSGFLTKEWIIANYNVEPSYFN